MLKLFRLVLVVSAAFGLDLLGGGDCVAKDCGSGGPTTFRYMTQKMYQGEDEQHIDYGEADYTLVGKTVADGACIYNWTFHSEVPSDAKSDPEQAYSLNRLIKRRLVKSLGGSLVLAANGGMGQIEIVNIEEIIDNSLADLLGVSGMRKADWIEGLDENRRRLAKQLQESYQNYRPFLEDVKEVLAATRSLATNIDLLEANGGLQSNPDRSRPIVFSMNNLAVQSFDKEKRRAWVVLTTGIIGRELPTSILGDYPGGPERGTEYYISEILNWLHAGYLMYFEVVTEVDTDENQILGVDAVTVNLKGGLGDITTSKFVPVR